MCDERDSQLSNGWLRKLGVLDSPRPCSLDPPSVRAVITSLTMACSERWVSQVLWVTKSTVSSLPGTAASDDAISHLVNAYSHAWRSLNNIHADHSITSMPITQ